MKPRALLLAAAAAAVVVTVLAMGGRDPAETGAAPPPPAAAPAEPTRRQGVAASGELQAPTWKLSPRPAITDPVAGVPGSVVPGTTIPAGPLPGAPIAPAILAERIVSLARQVDSGSGGDAFELYSMLNECAEAPHRLAISTGCVSGGDCAPAAQRASRYQETLAACQQVPHDLIGRRQQYLDLAASRGDLRAQAAVQPR